MCQRCVYWPRPRKIALDVINRHRKTNDTSSFIDHNRVYSHFNLTSPLSPLCLRSICLCIATVWVFNVWDLHDAQYIHVLLAGRWVLSVWEPVVYNHVCFRLLSVVYLIKWSTYKKCFVQRDVYGSTMCIKVRLPLWNNLICIIMRGSLGRGF